MKITKVLVCLVVIALAVWIYQNKFAEEVKSYGGVPTPDVAESAPARFERVTQQSAAEITRAAESNRARIELEYQTKLKNIQYWSERGVSNGPTDRPYRLPGK